MVQPSSLRNRNRRILLRDLNREERQRGNDLFISKRISMKREDLLKRISIDPRICFGKPLSRPAFSEPAARAFENAASLQLGL